TARLWTASQHRARRPVGAGAEDVEGLGVDPARLEVIAEEPAAVEQAVADGPEPLESLRRVREAKRLLEEERDRSFQGFARAAIWMGVIRQERNQVVRRPVRRLDAS